MGFGGALLAMSAVQGIASIGKGYAQSGEDNYNAQLETQQAQLQQVQGDIQQGQATRQASKMLSTSTADIAASGLQPTGSAAAVMLDAQTQIHTDMAIAKFNNTMAINRSNASAAILKQKASQDVFSGYSSAFSDVLTGVTNYAKYSGINTPKGSINTTNFSPATFGAGLFKGAF